MYSPPHTAWIWHKPPYHKVPSDDGWIEVIHRKDPFGDEQFGAWFLSAKGSGVWLNAGKSISFDDHSDACAHAPVRLTACLRTDAADSDGPRSPHGAQTRILAS